MDNQSILQQMQQMSPEEQKKSENAEAVRREMKRRSLDRIEIYNPLDKEYILYWDSRGFPLPPKAPSILFRYLAEKFMTEVIDKIIIQRFEDRLAIINKKRLDDGMSKLPIKEKGELMRDPEYQLNNRDNRRPLIREIWRGVVEEYGMNEVLRKDEPKHVDPRPIDEQLIEEIDNLNLMRQETQTTQRLLDPNFIEGEEMNTESRKVNKSTNK